MLAGTVTAHQRRLLGQEPLLALNRNWDLGSADLPTVSLHLAANLASLHIVQCANYSFPRAFVWPAHGFAIGNCSQQ